MFVNLYIHIPNKTKANDIVMYILRFLVTFHLLIPKTVWNWNKGSKLGISFINTEQSIVRSLDHHEW